MARLTRPVAALALLLVAAQAFAAPTRVVSLNMCTDELALLLAAPGQLASVSFLGADPFETVLAGRAKGIPTNNGRLDDVARYAPDLVLTMGGGDRYARELAARLGWRVVDLPSPVTIADVRRNVLVVAAALGSEAAGVALLTRFDAALGPLPVTQLNTLMISDGGNMPRPDGLAAQLLRYAGLTLQPVPMGAISLERLLSHPPQVIVQTSYRPGQLSLGQDWLAHPALRALPAGVRRVRIDGRAWTCMGPLAADGVATLRNIARPAVPPYPGLPPVSGAGRGR